MCAYAGSRLVMQDVTVVQTLNLCAQQQRQQRQSSSIAVVASEADLLAALTDSDIITMLVAADIKLHSSRWQVSEGAAVVAGQTCQFRHL